MVGGSEQSIRLPVNGPAAVHDEAVAGDKRGAVGQEEKGGADDLGILADAGPGLLSSY